MYCFFISILLFGCTIGGGTINIYNPDYIWEKTASENIGNGSAFYTDVISDETSLSYFVSIHKEKLIPVFFVFYTLNYTNIQLKIFINETECCIDVNNYNQNDNSKNYIEVLLDSYDPVNIRVEYVDRFLNQINFEYQLEINKHLQEYKSIYGIN